LAPDAIRYLNEGSASSPARKQCIIKLIMIHVIRQALEDLLVVS